MVKLLGLTTFALSNSRLRCALFQRKFFLWVRSCLEYQLQMSAADLPGHEGEHSEVQGRGQGLQARHHRAHKGQCHSQRSASLNFRSEIFHSTFDKLSQIGA